MREVRVTLAGRDASGGLTSAVVMAVVVAGAVWLAMQTRPGDALLGDVVDHVLRAGRDLLDTLTSWAHL
jgi:hypothetical protein